MTDRHRQTMEDTGKQDQIQTHTSRDKARETLFKPRLSLSKTLASCLLTNFLAPKFDVFFNAS